MAKHPTYLLILQILAMPHGQGSMSVLVLLESYKNETNVNIPSKSLESSQEIQNCLDISIFKVIPANLGVFEQQGKVARRKIHFKE